MPSHIKRLMTFSLLLLLMVSCGDTFMKKSEDEESRFNKFAECKPDTDALANIFKENIKGDLYCLGDNLNLFMDVVKTDRPGSLSLKELKIYIRKNIDGIEESVFDLLEAIFELNSVVMGDDPAYIKRENVNKLVELFVEINSAMVKYEVLKFYSEEEKISYPVHNARKARVFEALSKIGNEIIRISKPNNNRINFEEFLSKFQKVDSDDGIKTVLVNLPKLLYIKKLFLGGDSKYLNSQELRRLARMLPDIAKISFDISSLSIIEHSKNEVEELLETFSVGARSLTKNLYYPKGSSEKVMTLQDIFNTAEIFAEPLDPNSPETHISKWFKYKKEYLLTKEFLLGSKTSTFTGNEVQILFDDIISYNLHRSVQVYQSYRLNKTLLDTQDIITIDLDRISGPASKREDFEKMMNRIVQNYFFFKGKDPTGKFSREIKRSALGIAQIAILENILERVFKGKAQHSLNNIKEEIIQIQIELNSIRRNQELSRKEKRKLAEPLLDKMKKINIQRGEIDQGQIDGKHINQDVIVSLFSDYSRFLIDNDLVTRNREANTAETITLMTSLFQAQSDGDGNISVTEMTEFAVQLLGGMDTAKLGQKFYSEICENVEPNPEKPARVTPDCFRKNFLSFMESQKNDVKLKDQLGGLVRYMNKDAETAERYLKVAEGFTRSCTHFEDGSEIPYTEGEMLLAFTGMYAVEQTFVRYDLNGNNILDISEVDAAFEVYKPAIEALVPVDILKGQSKDFFLYLIKYKRLPDVKTKGRGIKGFFKAIKEGLKLIGFLYFRKDENKRATADRETIATILGVLSELSPEKQKNPFPCHTLGLEYDNEQEIESREPITQ
jgi:hypothetical protein